MWWIHYNCIKGKCDEFIITVSKEKVLKRKTKIRIKSAFDYTNFVIDKPYK